MLIRLLRLSASPCALAMLSGAAFAQSVAPAEPAAAVATEPQSDPNEIIVTARKRAERLIDVPVAVSALSGEQLSRYSTDTFAAIAQQTPQLVIGEAQSASGGVINLRGVGAGSSNVSTDQSVSINIDGIQISLGNALRLGQFDLQRVEVLKGPQALFYGKNSPAGILSIVSNDPGDNFETQLRGGYEFEASQRFVEGIVSGPLGGGFGARAVGYISKQDGYFRNIAIAVPGLTPGSGSKFAPGQTEKFARGVLTFNSPDDALSIRLKASVGDVDRNGSGISATSQQYYCPFGTPQLGGGITTDCKLDRNFTGAALDPAKAALDSSYGDGIPRYNSSQYLIGLSADYTVSDILTISSVTGFYKISEFFFDTFTATNLPFIAASADTDFRQFTQELRVSTEFDGPVNFLVGGFYQKSDLGFRNALLVDIPGVVTAVQPVPVYDLDTLAYSFFAQARYSVTEQLELSAGARISRERKELTGTVNDTPFTILRPNRNFKDFSPELTATYKPNTDLTIYASYREGFTSGGFNTTVQPLNSPATPSNPVTDPSFDQTEASGAEIGVKGYIADRQIRFDLTGYTYKYRGLQLAAFDPNTVSQTTRNAGGAKVRGVELNAFIRPHAVEGLELRGGAAYNNATYSSFIGGCYGGQTVALGCNLNPTNPTLPPSTFGTVANPYNSQDQAGQQLTRAPKWSLNSGFTYDRDLTAGIGASLSFDAAYLSSFAPDIEANPSARQGGYWVMNANLSVHEADDQSWALALIGRNLANTRAVTTSSSSPLTGGATGTPSGIPSDVFGSLIAPRALMLQLTLKLK